MRFLKTIVFILLILALVMIVLHFLAPKEYAVQRTVTIDAAPSMVWKKVGTLGAMQEWSPWAEHDTEMKISFHGTDGEVGAYSHWEGPESGVGEQRITAVEKNKRIDTELEFMEPWFMAGKADAAILLNENASGGTDVTWTMSGDQTFPFRSFSLLPGMNMEANIGPSYEKGLATLKSKVGEAQMEMEASTKAVADSEYQIDRVKKNKRIYVVKRKVVPMEGVSQFYEVQFPAIFTAVGVAGSEPAGHPSGLFYDWNEENGEADMCAAIPVSDNSLRIEGYETITIPAGDLLHVAYYGDYAGSEAAHIAIDNFMKANGLELTGPVIEEYVTDPTTEPDSKKWLTNIYYPINS